MRSGMWKTASLLVGMLWGSACVAGITVPAGATFELDGGTVDLAGGDVESRGTVRLGGGELLGVGDFRVLAGTADDGDILAHLERQREALAERLQHYHKVVERIDEIIQHEREAREVQSMGHRHLKLKNVTWNRS